MTRSCFVNGCLGDKSWQKPTPLSFFRVPSIIAETNKKFSGYGKEESKKKLIELSRKRRKAWLRALRSEHVADDAVLKICARHFISGQPADLEDEDSPDWVPSLNLGYKTSMVGKTKAAVRRHERHKMNEKRSEAVSIYGGCSDPPVFIETEETENAFTSNSADNSSPKDITVADSQSPAEANNTVDEDDAIAVDDTVSKDSNSLIDMPSDPNEKYGHWHVHFCTKRDCLFSKAAAKCYSIDNLDDEDE